MLILLLPRPTKEYYKTQEDNLWSSLIRRTETENLFILSAIWLQQLWIIPNTKFEKLKVECPVSSHSQKRHKLSGFLYPLRLCSHISHENASFYQQIEWNEHTFDVLYFFWMYLTYDSSKSYYKNSCYRAWIHNIKKF